MNNNAVGLLHLQLSSGPDLRGITHKGDQNERRTE